MKIGIGSNNEKRNNFLELRLKIGKNSADTEIFLEFVGRTGGKG